jgi:cytoskeletal protein CcmA (bactofilin family)
MSRPDKTVIGPSITIEGEVDSDDALVVQGRITGKITCEQDVTIEAEAEVEAEVSAETLVVSGRLDGPAAAKVRVELTSHGRMSGDIRSPRIQIADGAQYKGNVDMS